MTISKELKILGPTTLEQTMDWAERIDRKLGMTICFGRRYGGNDNSGRRFGGSSGGGWYQPNSDSKQKTPNFANPNFANSNPNPNFQNSQSRFQPNHRWAGPGQSTGRAWQGNESSGGRIE